MELKLQKCEKLVRFNPTRTWTHYIYMELKLQKREKLVRFNPTRCEVRFNEPPKSLFILWLLWYYCHPQIYTGAGYGSLGFRWVYLPDLLSQQGPCWSWAVSYFASYLLLVLRIEQIDFSSTWQLTSTYHVFLSWNVNQPIKISQLIRSNAQSMCSCTFDN